MIRREFLKYSGLAGFSTLLYPGWPALSGDNKSLLALEELFQNPPPSARPGNMWFWMNGHVTREGITLDLEAMHRIGVGAVFNFDAGTGIPKGPLEYLSPEWFAIKAFALKECNRLGIDFCMHNCPGWSSSGGPWITPDRSMKTLVWSEVQINTAGKEDSIALPVPEHKLEFYQDVCVLAFPSLPPDTPPFASWERRTNKEYNRGLGPIDPALPAINPAHIVVATAWMDTEGNFDLKALKTQASDSGNQSYTLQRFGYTSLGTLNRSSPDTGLGLECDKFDPEAVAFHFDKMITPLLPFLEPLARQGKMALEIDSWEVGMQNWTGGFETEFETRNSYSPIAYLPAMTGKLVGSADETDRFLWDLRRTQADMIADHYYGKMAELCHRHGIRAYFEPYDRGPMEEIQIGSRGDLSMGEYWYGLSTIFQNNLTMRRTCKLASSVAHISGQRIVGVEGLTAEPEAARWQEYAFAMKPVCDKMFTMGINRILVHRNAHQPHPTAMPGMTMGPWGIHFDRTNSLWDANKGWVEYLTRCQSLLQHGLFVADLAYFTGEEPGVYTDVLPVDLKPGPPAGFDYDLINAETLLLHSRIDQGRLALPDGMSYRVLILQDTRQISLDLLRLIRSFVEHGLIVVGQKPVSSPGLKGRDPQVRKEFESLVRELWGTGDNTEKTIGHGKLYWGQTINEIVEDINLTPDCRITSKSGDAPIQYIHRRSGEGDVYFLSNQRRTTEELVVTFRVSGKQPELWDAVTGKSVPASCFTSNRSGTQVALTLMPYGSVFVVFRDAIQRPGIATIIKEKDQILSSEEFASANEGHFEANGSLANNFTLSFWARPENNIMLSTAALYEGVPHSWTDYYAIYPSDGKTLYGDGHAGSGVTVGRNGVAIWENGNEFPEFNHAAAQPISGWTHIGVVYREGVPIIYINGREASQGEKKFDQIHPSAGDPVENIFWISRFYNGDLAGVKVLPRALNPEELESLARQAVPPHATIMPDITPGGNQGSPAMYFWSNGTYSQFDQQGQSHSLEVSGLRDTALTGAWEVHFPSDRGAPDNIILENLISLKDHPEAGVKYFSGTASYRKTFILEADHFQSDKQLFLDLGQVEVVAEVWLNGACLGNYWTRPYLVEITQSARVGENQLEVRVTNQWVNRLIGDAQMPDLYEYTTMDQPSPFRPLAEGAIRALPQWYLDGAPKPVDGQVTFTTWKHHHRDSPLLDAGLIGPVMIREALEMPVS
ncbi:MAG: hypothetical protein KDC28_17705 [Saprospiraceae bacterium]|nr:hypothetical protein [Saprospiraceae bacterium]MCB9320505.1 glycosyl hydrolase family 43 [Lewinellaceae bacterium]